MQLATTCSFSPTNKRELVPNSLPHPTLFQSEHGQVPLGCPLNWEKLQHSESKVSYKKGCDPKAGQEGTSWPSKKQQLGFPFIKLRNKVFHLVEQGTLW